jgi:maltooligosyltrehalose synthase
MGLLVDIVPNHMGVSDSGNRLWMSVLEHGRASVYSDFFDIDWNRPGCEVTTIFLLNNFQKGKLMVPNLGAPLGKVVDNGEIQIIYHEDSRSFRFKYYALEIPVDPHSYPIILNPTLSLLSQIVRQILFCSKFKQEVCQQLGVISSMFKELPLNSESEISVKNQRLQDSDDLKSELCTIHFMASFDIL